MPLTEMKKMLLKAFDEGIVVVIDDNSIPLKERWFNDVLMGKRPTDEEAEETLSKDKDIKDKEVKVESDRPPHPGFTIIATRNPYEMGGRYQQSTAFDRRVTTLHLPPYAREELVAILAVNGVALKKAELIVSIYLKQFAYAKKHDLKPAPTFRALQEVAKDYLAAEGAKKLEMKQPVNDVNLQDKKERVYSNQSTFQSSMLLFGAPAEVSSIAVHLESLKINNTNSG